MRHSLTRPLASAALALLAAAPLRAADSAQIERLWQALKMPEVIGVMQDEGKDYGESLDEDMLDGTGGQGWADEVAAIYATDWMTRTSHAAFDKAMAPLDVQPAIDFFESDLGREVIDLELAAREAMLDPDLDEAARATAGEMTENGGARFDLLSAFAEANDLVDSNVAGALNSNYAFYQGLAEGGALGPEMDDDAILSEVWSQEDEVRVDTREWVLSFTALAYQPLSDDELQRYIDFSKSEAGQDLNRGVFQSFDSMFNTIARRLGKAVAGRLMGEEL